MNAGERRREGHGQGRPGQDRGDPAGVRLGVDRPAEHDRAERVGDVPQGLGQAAGDRVDAGRANAHDQVDQEGVRPELEPLGDRADDRAAAEPQLLGQERARRSDRERPVAPGDPADRDHGDRQRDQVHDQGNVQAEPGDRGRADRQGQEQRPAQDPDLVVGQDPAATEQGEQADGEEQLARDRQRGEQELLPGQVRDQARQRPVRPGVGRQAVQPAGQHDAQPADDGRPDEGVGEPAPGRLRVAPRDDAEGAVHAPAGDQGGQLRGQQDQRETASRRTARGAGPGRCRWRR